MDAADKQCFIRAHAAELQIKWSRHALGELAPDDLTVADVEAALRHAEVIEDYAQQTRYLPDCIVLTFDTGKQPIHAVIAIHEAESYILVVTVYRPNDKEWEHDWRTRK